VGRTLRFETERNLLRLGGIHDLDVLAADPHRRDIAIHNAQTRITGHLQKYWTQDASRIFHLDIDGDKFRIRVSDAAKVFDFPEARSLGSRWFISFYINFALRIEGASEREQNGGPTWI